MQTSHGEFVLFKGNGSARAIISRNYLVFFSGEINEAFSFFIKKKSS